MIASGVNLRHKLLLNQKKEHNGTLINFNFGIRIIEILPKMLSQKIVKSQMDQKISGFHLYICRIRYRTRGEII